MKLSSFNHDYKSAMGLKGPEHIAAVGARTIKAISIFIFILSN